jgi:hypothetical protein
MDSFELIFVPREKTRGEVEIALREPVHSAEFIETSVATRPEPIEDAEQLPLWRWFTF